MPIYEYGCESCGKITELVQKFSDEPLKTCPDCGQDVKKLISRTSFVLKGSGWYTTDYKRAPAATASAPSTTTKSDAGGATTAATVPAATAPAPSAPAPTAKADA